MEDYLLEHHKRDIFNILKASKREQKFEIFINLTILHEENEKLFKNLIQNYDFEVVNWNGALLNVQNALVQASESANLVVKQNSSIKLSKHPAIDSDFKIQAEVNLFKLVAFRATIVKKHLPKTRVVTKKFMCTGCKAIVIVNASKYYGYGFYHGRCQEQITVNDGNGKEAFSGKCLRKVIPCKYTEKKYIKTLTTQLYEVTVPHLEKHQSYGDRTYFVDVEGSLINAFEVGEAVDIIGIVKTRGTKPKPNQKRFGIYALNIELEEKLDLSKDFDTNMQFRLLGAWNHDLEQNGMSEVRTRNEIVQNVFPTYVGANAVKLSIILAVCSGSGTSLKTENDTEKSKQEVEKRDVFHLMLAGRKNAGKRTLLRLATELTTKSNEVMSFGLSVNSLTARAFKVKQGEANNIEAGVLLRASDGISCFHEFNTLKKQYRKILHEIMETQMIKITTAKLKANIKLNTSIIAALRIKEDPRRGKRKRGEIVPEAPISLKMFKIEESLLNRFDLIFIMKEPREDNDYAEQNFNMLLDEAMGVEREESPNWPRDRITAHIALAKTKTFGSVKLTKEVDQILFKYFLFCSMNRNIPKWRTTLRMYEGLKRITVAHARLMLRTESKIFDAITTIMLSELSYPLGFLMNEYELNLNDNLPGPNDEYAMEVLRRLGMPEEYATKYLQEQSDISNINQTLESLRCKISEFSKDDEYAVFDENSENIDIKKDKVFRQKSIEDYTQFQHSFNNEAKKKAETSTQIQAASTLSKYKKAKILTPASENKAKAPNLKKHKNSAATTSNPRKRAKKQENQEEDENFAEKRAKVEEENKEIMANDFILANLALLSKQFESMPSNNEEKIVKVNESSVKAHENFEKQFEDELEAMRDGEYD